jgi:D-galactonate transporter
MSTVISSWAAPNEINQQEGVYRKVALRLIPLLFVCYIAAYLDRVNVGFAKLQMQGTLQFSEAVYGLGAGIFFVGYFLFEVPSNVLLHKVGARKWIARIMITWGLLSASMIFVHTPMSFYVLRFLLGAAEAGFFPGIILYLTYWYPEQRRGRAMSLFLTAIPVSGILGGPLSGWILKSLNNANGLQGWQWLFLLEGLPTLALGALVWMLLDDKPAHAKWLAPRERELVEANIAAEASRKTDLTFMTVLTSGKVWLLSLVYFCLVSGLYGVSFWLPTIIKALGVNDPLDVGLLSAVPWTFAVVAMYLNARSADRNLEHRWHVAVPAMVGAVGLVASIALHGNTLVSMVGLTVGTMGIMAALPVFWGLPTGFLGGVAAATGIAFINSCGNLSGFVAPYVVGMLKDATKSTDAGMSVLAASIVVGAIAALCVPRHRSAATQP